MKDKLKAIQEFYQTLYTADNIRKEDIESYMLQNIQGKIADRDVGVLEKRIEAEEIEQVIKNLKNAKTPGPDGIGPEFYKIFKVLLIPKLKRLFNEILDGGKPQTLGNIH